MATGSLDDITKFLTIRAVEHHNDVKEEIDGSDSGNEQVNGKQKTPGGGGRLRAPRWKDLKEEIERGDLRREPVNGEVSKYIDRIFDTTTNQPLYFFCKLCNRVFVHNNSSSSNRRHLRETHGLKISRTFADGANDSTLNFDVTNGNENVDDESENVFSEPTEWPTQTTSGELLNRFLDEAELQQTQKELDLPTSNSTNSIWPIREVTPISQISQMPQLTVPPVQAVKQTQSTKPISKVKASNLLRSVFKRRKPRIQLLRERLLAARARKENALAMKALAEANRVKLETMILIHRAGFVRTLDKKGQPTLQKMTNGHQVDVINDSDYDVSINEGQFGNVQDEEEE